MVFPIYIVNEQECPFDLKKVKGQVKNIFEQPSRRQNLCTLLFLTRSGTVLLILWTAVSHSLTHPRASKLTHCAQPH